MDRDPDLSLRNSRELLIMASIVEKESGLPQELRLIAGLYLHRLSIGMRLQADPTVIYGMGDRYDGDIRTVDLRTDGPYNTYTRTGLPPTPIALPAAAVIRATAHPEKTSAVYFVASPKGDGSHVFRHLAGTQRGVAASATALQSQGMRCGRDRRRFLTIQGIEGVGKTTQVARLSEALRARGIGHVVTREPGGTPLAEKIREIVLNEQSESLPPTAELLLMFAARAVHLANHVEPHLKAGRWVVCDRFTDATYAYQGGGRGLNTDHIRQLETMVQGSRRPDLTVLLDAPVEQALRRARQRNSGAATDRFESERVEFFERVREAYRARAAAEPDRIIVIAAHESADAVAARILELLEARRWIS
jgi:dTMP kinase